MKIVVLTQYFPPDGPGWIPRDIATEMNQRGHDVRVLTSFPHYKTGKVAKGYRQKFHHVEDHGNIKVKRVPIFPSHSRNPIGRIANYMSFSLSARVAKAFVEDADVIYVNGAPATVAEPARAWSKALGIPFVYHVQDIWPESVTESAFLPRRVLDVMRGGINKWLSHVYSRAAAVIAIAPTAKNLLVARGVPESRAHVVYNWSMSCDDVLRKPSEGLSLLYAGNLGDFQDLDTVIHSAKAVSHLPGVRFQIAGDGVARERLKSLVSALSLESVVEFLGTVDRSRMAELYADADFQIVPLKDLEFFACTIPSKFQAGLANGLPVITTVRGDVSNLVRENDLGFVAQPENVESLAAAYLAAYESSAEERLGYSERSKSFFDKNFTKQIAMDRIEEILLSVVRSESQREWEL